MTVPPSSWNGWWEGSRKSKWIIFNLLCLRNCHKVKLNKTIILFYYLINSNLESYKPTLSQNIRSTLLCIHIYLNSAFNLTQNEWVASWWATVGLHQNLVSLTAPGHGTSQAKKCLYLLGLAHPGSRTASSAWWHQGRGASVIFICCFPLLKIYFSINFLAGNIILTFLRNICRFFVYLRLCKELGKVLVLWNVIIISWGW